MRKWLPLVAICTGAFMLLVDVTIVIVALPDMATGLKTSFSALQWVLDIYALALAALLLGAGTIADLAGRRRVYVLGLVVFALSSLACGLAGNIALLITARCVQGIGAAAMLATTMALINDIYRGKDRAVAFGIWGAVNGAAAAAGPIAGGLLVAPFGWRAVFLVNLPVSLIAIALALKAMPESRNPRARGVDVPGLVSFAAAAGALTYGLIRASEDGWGEPAAYAALVAGGVMLAVFLLVEARRPEPLLDLSLFRRVSFSALMVASALIMLAAFAYGGYLSLWLQSVLGLSAIETGLVILPMSAVAFVVAGVGGRLFHSMSARWPIGIGSLFIGAGALAQSRLSAGSDWTAVLLGMAVTGLGVGMATPSLASAALGEAPLERGGMVSGALNTFRQLGYAFGVALLGGVFRSGMTETLRGHLPDPAGAADALGGGAARQIASGSPEAGHLVRAAFAEGLDDALMVAGLTGLAAGVLVLLTVRRRPAPSPEPAAAILDETAPGPVTVGAATAEERGPRLKRPAHG